MSCPQNQISTPQNQAFKYPDKKRRVALHTSYITKTTCLVLRKRFVLPFSSDFPPWSCSSSSDFPPWSHSSSSDFPPWS